MARILVIEDSQGTIFGYKEFLNYKLTFSRTAAEAYQQYTAGRYDLIITDGDLPDGRGWEIISKLRSKFKQLPPVIAVTNALSEERKRLWNQAGVLQILPKPVTDWRPLITEVERVLAKTRAA